jgi:transcriptional regulator with XRE-family HTH domain
MPRTPKAEPYSQMQVEIGRRLKQVRQFTGDSKAATARMLSVDPSTVAKIEDGTRAASIFFVIEIANRYRVTTDYLLAGVLDRQCHPDMRTKIQAAGEAALARESQQKRRGSGMGTALDGGKCRQTKTLAPSSLDI